MLVHGTHSYSLFLWLCLVSIVLLVVFSYYYWTLPSDMMMKMGNYIQLITVFLLTISAFVTLLSFKHQTEDRHRSQSLQYANLTQNEINDIDKQFMSNPLLDRLYYEMYAHTPQVQRIRQMRHPPVETPEMLKMEQHMASIIFQKIADIYFCEELDKNNLIDSSEWINTFRRWMQSPILVSHWISLREEHHPSVRQFVEQILLKN